MRSIKVPVLLVVALANAATAGADVQLSMHDGRVSIVAKDATVGEILAEWARVGQTKVVNPEAIPRERVTIELKDVSEDEALAILLRKASGYIAAPRAIALPDASRFDRILVMPPSVARMSVNTRPPAEVSAPPAGAPPDDEPPAEQAPPNAAPTYPTPAGQTPGNEGRAGRTTAHQAQPYAGDGQAGQADRAEQTEQVTQQPPPDTRWKSGPREADEPDAVPPDAAGTAAVSRTNLGAAIRDTRDHRFVAPLPTADAGTVNEEPPPPAAEATVPIPPADPQAQAAFKQRRATETVDPRTFHFEMPKPAVAAPAAAPGAVKPGVTTPSTTKPGGPGVQ